MAVTHNTFVIEREYPKTPEKVFAAFADTTKKKRWYAASGAHDVVSYENDFRAGGREVLVGKMKPGTPIAGVVLTWSQDYKDIVENQRVVGTQTLDMGAVRASVAIVSVELFPTGDGCRVVLTHQAVFFEQSDGPQMREFGWRALLDAVEGALD